MKKDKESDKQEKSTKIEKKVNKNTSLKKKSNPKEKKSKAKEESKIVVDNKENVIEEVSEVNKATFIQRFMAFLVDFILVVMVVSFVSTPFMDTKNSAKLSESQNQILEQYSNGEISYKTCIYENMSISYQNLKINGISSLIMIFAEIMYFIVFQFYYGGRTLGKKLLKIKVVSTDGELSMNQMLFRSLIVDSILMDLIAFCLALFASKDVFIYGELTFEFVQYAILIVSAGMIIYGKNGKGIHDYIVHTNVVKD